MLISAPCLVIIAVIVEELLFRIARHAELALQLLHVHSALGYSARVLLYQLLHHLRVSIPNGLANFGGHFALEFRTSGAGGGGEDISHQQFDSLANAIARASLHQTVLLEGDELGVPQQLVDIDVGVDGSLALHSNTHQKVHAQ